MKHKQAQKFVETVKKYYIQNGRSNLPWRETKDPYKILVSEVMLQQTQVDRVLPKYKSFIKKWPDAQRLAAAPLSKVFIEWQGLGYNRRAKMLHNCAKEVMEKYDAKFPKDFEKLKALPGIGPYTAGAVMAFAYNTAVPIIETNIRTVYLHNFFKDKTDVTDKEIVRYIVLTLDEKNPREWYWALMDYGTCLKKEFGNPNKQSKHYTKQSKFEGSDRQIRGVIVRALAEGKCPLTRKQLHKKLSQFEDIRIDAQLEKLLTEEMIIKEKQKYSLPR